MNSIFAALSQEVDHPELSEYILAVQYDFSKGAIKTGISNLKAIREIFVHENVPEYLVEALDTFIKAITGKKFNDPKSSRKTIEEIMFIIYPVEDEEDYEYVLEQSDTIRELNRMNDDDEEDDDEEDDEEDEDDEDDEEDDDDEEEDDDDEEEDDEDVDRYNDLLNNKTLNKYIVAKRFKITTNDDEDKEKIEALYKLVKNICNNFSSDKDADNLLSVLEDLDELRE
jgi:hypothetical protein